MPPPCLSRSAQSGSLVPEKACSCAAYQMSRYRLTLRRLATGSTQRCWPSGWTAWRGPAGGCHARRPAPTPCCRPAGPPPAAAAPGVPPPALIKPGTFAHGQWRSQGCSPPLRPAGTEPAVRHSSLARQRTPWTVTTGGRRTPCRQGSAAKKERSSVPWVFVQGTHPDA